MNKAKSKKQHEVKAESKAESKVEKKAQPTAETAAADAAAAAAAAELEAVRAELQQAQDNISKLQDACLHSQAEFENYKRRTAAEKERIYGDALQDLCKELLPLIDNLSRAKDAHEQQLAAAENLEDKAKELVDSLTKGSDLLYQQGKKLLDKLGVSEIEALGATFDPNCHAAVLHVEDEQYGENEVIEVFEPGYKFHERVLRPAVVKVAN